MFALLVVWLLAQPRPLTVRVIDNTTQTPLPNAEVVNRVTGERHFTNSTGAASIPRADGQLALRVRQIGFQFVDSTVPPSVETITFALTRVAYVLPAIHTTAVNACDVATDSTAVLLSATVLGQLRLAAERYEEFRKAYPFRVELERRTGSVTPDWGVTPTRAQIEREHSDRWGERYVPERIVQRTPLGFTVPILFLSALADPNFWERHCFVAQGIEALDSERVVRLAFMPKRTVTTPDWEGAALVDSATSILRRVEFRLTGLKSGDQPRRLEGYSTFMSPAPYFVVPDTTRAIWWRRDVPPQGPWEHRTEYSTSACEVYRSSKQLPPSTTSFHPDEAEVFQVA